MSAITAAPPEAQTEVLPPVPLTIEGSSALHQMIRIRWNEWRALPRGKRKKIANQAASALARLEGKGEFQTAIFSLLGHKGDLLIVHFRENFEELNRAEMQLNQLQLADYFEVTHSYLSVVELGLYESSVKTYDDLARRGIVANTPEWQAEVEDVMARQREAMRVRLFPEIPDTRYICFYPMDRRRGEHKNWYSLPLEERRRQMHEHGLIGRRYAGVVKQIITGSIGFDDWEWGVDLFADDPLAFKKLIYEMRFDEVSAEYALFGTFYVGVRCPASGLPALLRGELPESRGE